MRVLGIIPARGGSKGIPRKNIKQLAGKPLLQYTAEAARRSTRLTQLMLSTDDVEIAAVGEALGLWIPFLRPAFLAEDDTSTLSVVLHLVDWLTSEGNIYDAYCLLQPTTPFRTYQNIDEALTLFTDCKADSVVSVIPAPHHFHPNWQLTITPTQSLSLWNGKPLNEITSRRQQLSSTYVRNGALYIASHSALLKYRSLYGQHCVAYVMPSEGHVNLDTDEDWMLAEQILRQSS